MNDTRTVGPAAILWLLIYFAGLIWSVVAPKDLLTWFLEVLPALIGLGVLTFSYKRFPLTPLVYQLILIHCLILMIGGHYTYAEVPLFDWLKETFSLARNNYDKVGHLAQGFVPAIITREVLSRLKVVNGQGWQHFLILCICLAISACYELIEWGVALLSTDSAEAFLGTQGYIWDTQSDMALALIGAALALLTLSRYHNRQLQRLLQ